MDLALHARAPIRVLIADDIPELRALLRTTLQGRGFQLVGEAGNGGETLRLAADQAPDVVVLDLGMPGVDGPDLIAELRRRVPAARVVALSAFASQELRREAFDRGAHACLEKDVDLDELVTTLREVCGLAFAPVALPPPEGLDGQPGEELERVWSCMAAAPVATAVVGPDGRFLKVNTALCALVGHPPAALLAAGYQAIVHPEDRDADTEQLQRVLAGETTGYQLQERCRRVDGEAISVLCNTWLATNQRGEPLHLDGQGRPRYVVRQLVDLREGRHPEDQLAWRATHDALTGLPNRSLFLDRLEMTLARLGREPALATVLVLDLDRFKEVGERFGDDAVDRLLVAVAGRLRSILRPSDTVSRFGSDEFAVLCPDLGHERDAVRLAERITAGLATPFAVGGQEIVVSASIGIALTGSRTRRADSLLSDADTALQRAKQRGGGIYELFDETVRAQLIERLELERALRHAVDADELRALYQPIVSLKEGRLVGVEALVRWEQPGRGQRLPAEFVPFAEETGLIVPLGAWVLAEGCRQAARWRAKGPRPLPPTMHVNLSPRQFTEPHLIDLVAGALADTGTDPDRLCLEVTERALATNPASAATTLKRLSALGVRVSVDDFGTGYSSLASLQYLPISSLKIDRSFVARLDLDPSDDAMVAAVIGLGHTLGLTVIAEGVETPRQLAKLDQLGCDYAQGYLFARPETAARVGELLGHDRRWQ
ncbi:MAG TPA: EAL domain-containing protein [Actinomycetes bacterium]|jgi:diguanylate cyclase (GGDEF)-like protein/PAS domain S-box-containing protein|nr:EAL domain-containing protein [Actinomycetes bacterium]